MMEFSVMMKRDVHNNHAVPKFRQDLVLKKSADFLKIQLIIIMHYCPFLIRQILFIAGGLFSARELSNLKLGMC